MREYIPSPPTLAFPNALPLHIYIPLTFRQVPNFNSWGNCSATDLMVDGHKTTVVAGLLSWFQTTSNTAAPIQCQWSLFTYTEVFNIQTRSQNIFVSFFHAKKDLYNKKGKCSQWGMNPYGTTRPQYSISQCHQYVISPLRNIAETLNVSSGKSLMYRKVNGYKHYRRPQWPLYKNPPSYVSVQKSSKASRSDGELSAIKLSLCH